MKIFLSIIFAFQLSIVNAQFEKFSNINDIPNKELVQLLEQSNFGKITIYFNEKTNEEGTWEYYPELKISKNLTAVVVRTLPEIKGKYTFVIIVDTELKKINETIGPFYDSFVLEGKFIINENNIHFAKIIVNNPPEKFNSKYSIFEYKRKGQKLVETKSYNKN